MDDDLMFYKRCWRELESFLSEIDCDDSDEVPYAFDLLVLMKKIEDKQR